MADNIIVMPGSARLDLSPLDAVAREFGWKVRTVEDAGEIAAVASRQNARGVLLCRNAFGSATSWKEAIRQVRFAFPAVPVIALYGFSEPIGWSELSDAGAFHSLWLPLKKNEVRQSLGFLANAERTPSGLPEWSSTTIERALTAGSAFRA